MKLFKYLLCLLSRAVIVSSTTSTPDPFLQTHDISGLTTESPPVQPPESIQITTYESCSEFVAAAADVRTKLGWSKDECKTIGNMLHVLSIGIPLWGNCDINSIHSPFPYNDFSYAIGLLLLPVEALHLMCDMYHNDTLYVQFYDSVSECNVTLEEDHTFDESDLHYGPYVFPEQIWEHIIQNMLHASSKVITHCVKHHGQDSSSLTTAQWIGIGIGIAIGVAGILLFVYFLVWRNGKYSQIPLFDLM